jgi:hypothetical protein
MVLNQDDFVNDIPNDVCIPLRMDNLDIQEFYQLGYGLDDVPNNLPIESIGIYFFCSSIENSFFSYFNIRYVGALSTSMNFCFTRWSCFFTVRIIDWFNWFDCCRKRNWNIFNR